MTCERAHHHHNLVAALRLSEHHASAESPAEEQESHLFLPGDRVRFPTAGLPIRENGGRVSGSSMVYLSPGYRMVRRRCSGGCYPLSALLTSS
eukprot:3121979-Rhodomonas_salina.2